MAAPNTRWIGLWIKNRRLEKDWSQAGLCRGICAVSYLSKIEQGKAEASPDVLHALAARLEESWDDSPETMALCAEETERIYDIFFYGGAEYPKEIFQSLEQNAARFRSGPYWLDWALLRQWYGALGQAETLAPYEEAMDARQHPVYLLLTEQYERAMRLYPCSATYFWSGEQSYCQGEYALAIERLTEGCRLAAEEGSAWWQMSCRLCVGTCYSNIGNLSQMRAHYRVAARLVAALGDSGAEYTMQYNLATTELEQGNAEQAYAFFSSLEKPNVMALHKLAVCCEKLGRQGEALRALNRAETCADAAERELCALVRYRLEHPDYLREEQYGALLLGTFAKMRKEASSGYALFHLPWVLEWYGAHRQYKETARLLLEFSSIPSLNML